MTDQQHWLLGIDGGGTSCRVRLCDASGNTLGQGESGSANVRLGASTVFQSIAEATEQALKTAGLNADILSKTYAGLGLAGAVSEQLNLSITEYPHPFADLCIDNDAVIACLGAHRGHDGAILILGTGSCAMLKHQQQFQVLGGWGLTISDHGSGARLGLNLVREALAAFEGLVAQSPLSQVFMQQHQQSPAQLLHWADNAKPRDFAALVPMIINYYQHHDPLALQLIETSLQEITLMLNRLQGMGAKRIALMGGYANFIAPLLTERQSAIITPAQGDALDGAIIMAKNLAKGN
ncbi:MAG: N-acetylglucosamine kinase [Oceanospirillaceae bacterium]|nr:N-acetylglucosamine kinase [Oceanospirillaceae bacterium]